MFRNGFWYFKIVVIFILFLSYGCLDIFSGSKKPNDDIDKNNSKNSSIVDKNQTKPKNNHNNGSIEIYNGSNSDIRNNKGEGQSNLSNVVITILPTDRSDALLILLGKEKSILIGTGSLSSYNVLEYYIDFYGIKELSLVILPTELDEQIGSFQILAKKYYIDEIWKYPLDFQKLEFKDALNIAKMNGSRVLNVQRGFYKNFSDLKIKILSPDENLLQSPEQDSLVIELNYKNFCMLIFTETEMMIENKLKGLSSLKKCNILKGSRHGGATATSDLLIRTIEPEVIIFTTSGKDNSPHTTTLERIKIYNATSKTKVNVYMTHVNGKIDIKTDGINYDVGLQNV